MRTNLTLKNTWKGSCRRGWKD